jgi:mono/diheme cytochrome c family protein
MNLMQIAAKAAPTAAAKAAPTGFGRAFVGAALAAIFTVLAGSHATAQDAPFPIAAWSRTTAAAEDTGAPADRGAAVFNNWCSACHSRGPLNAPGTTSLQNKYQGALPAALEDRTDLTAEVMFYRKTEISDSDLTALAAYLVEQ